MEAGEGDEAPRSSRPYTFARTDGVKDAFDSTENDLKGSTKFCLNFRRYTSALNPFANTLQALQGRRPATRRTAYSSLFYSTLYDTKVH